MAVKPRRWVLRVAGKGDLLRIDEQILCAPCLLGSIAKLMDSREGFVAYVRRADSVVCKCCKREKQEAQGE
jgi:hypothetical protein